MTNAVHATVSTLLTLLLAAPLASADAIPNAGIEDIPVVLTPVRLKQPRTEVPASVTVIDRALIQASGIRELAEVFRLVPGTAVGARDGWNYVVSYHGTSYRDSRRMQVLVDGRSVYQAGLATIDWNDIPLAIEDIERIEVVRGPNTAAYGANAFLGVINIITRHPDDSPALRIKATAGNNSVEDYYASTSGNLGNSSYRISAQSRRDSGFDINAEGLDRRDSKNLQLINGRWTWSPHANWNFELLAGYKTGGYTDDIGDPTVVVRGLPPVIVTSPPNQNVKDYFLSVRSQHFLSPNHSIKWQLDHARQREITEWQTCLPALFLGIPSTTVVCGTTDENGRNARTDFDLQSTWLGGNWQLVGGAHAKQARVKSQTYFNGSVDSNSYQLFANFEYRFLPQWSVTLAGSQEYQEALDEHFSPRVALNYFLTDHHSFRAVMSKAVRIPDLLETQADWTYTARDLQPVIDGHTSGVFQARAVAPDGLHEETILSREFGYYGLWLDRRLEWDVKAFWDDLDDLISKQLTFGNFTPDNNSWVDQQGVETELDFRASQRWRLRLTYALINSDTNNLREEDLTAHKSGSAGVIYQPGYWQLSAFYYYADPINNRKFSRADLRIARRIPVAGGRVTVSGVVQHYQQDTGDLFSDNRYDQSNRAYLAVDLTF